MTKYRSNLVVDAEQVTPEWFDPDFKIPIDRDHGRAVLNNQLLRVGDWVLVAPNGRAYVCSAEIFKEQYVEVADLQSFHDELTKFIAFLDEVLGCEM